MLTAIHLENFKGVRDRVRVELRPLTLLFGPNSAGKSTVLQALQYAREIFDRHNLDPGRTLHGADLVDLGGFANLVHGRDLERTVVLGFDLDLTAIDLPAYLDPAAYDGATLNTLDAISLRVERATVEIAVRWNRLLGAPEIVRYAVALNGQPFAAIASADAGKQIAMTELDVVHPVVEDLETPADLVEATVTGLNLLGQRSALPVWGERLAFESRAVDGWFPLAVAALTALVTGPGQLLRDALRSLRYLGPLRATPPRTYEPARSPDESRWASGLAAWDALSLDDALCQKASAWLSQEDKLDAGYEVRIKRYKEIDLDSPLMVALATGRRLDEAPAVETALARLPVRQRLVLVDAATRLELLPQDVGVGISQVVPVVVAALAPGADVVGVEQPELHVHPRIQVALGDLFIAASAAGTMLLIETHSEHLMLRLLRRIRETTEGALPPGAPPLTTDRVAVYNVERDAAGAVKLTPQTVEAGGDFSAPWPRGFFEERAKELF